VIDSNQDEIRQQQAAHTRVPNLYMDIVLWLLSDVEKDCILYILRKTIGWSGSSPGERKSRDTISLSQFETGIVSGDYLFNLGVNRSKNSIKRALDGLIEKDLIEPRSSCTHCWWEEGDEANKLEKAGSCPRCAASLSRSYALAALTPNKILVLLNENERQQTLGRRFEWDVQMKRFRVVDEDSKQRKEDARAELEKRYNEIREKLWYPEIIDEIIEAASRLLKGRKIQLGRQVSGFLEPALKMQEEYKQPPLVKYALEQTLAGPVFQGAVGKPTNSWFRYAERVCANNRNTFLHSSDHADSGRSSPEQLEQLARKRLREAALLNGTDKAAEAREILERMLEALEQLAILFDGSSELAEYQLRLAFKQGASDLVGVRAERHAADFDPDWDPGAGPPSTVGPGI